MNQTEYQIIGDGFSVTIKGGDTLVGSIVQGVIDATLGPGDSVNIERVK